MGSHDVTRPAITVITYEKGTWHAYTRCRAWRGTSQQAAVIRELLGEPDSDRTTEAGELGTGHD